MNTNVDNETLIFIETYPYYINSSPLKLLR